MTESVASRQGREGGRWVNQRPTSEEFAEWFRTSMRIDDGLRVEDYIGGVVLIPGVDSNVPYIVDFQNGRPVIERREELSYTPYAKVETRTAYFWDLLEAHPEWCAVVERVTPPRIPLDFVTTEETVSDESGTTTTRSHRRPGALTSLVHQLPDGLSITSVPVGEGYSHFLICTTRVAIHRANAEGLPVGKPLRQGIGSKQVPLLAGRHTPYADPNSMMKAETGSMGRALGFAGIFVIPGSGVATAEDMMESMAQGPPPAEAAPTNAGPEAPQAPPVRSGAEVSAESDEALLARAGKLYAQLSQESPVHAEEFGRWANERRLRSLSDARGPVLRGAVRKLEKLIDTQGGEDGRSAETQPGADAG